MSKTGKFLKENLIWAALFILVVFFSFTAKNFTTLGNAMNVLNQSVTLGIMAAGVVFVQLAGGVDLTVGAQISICGIVTGLLIKAGAHPVIASICGILTCVAIGVINGLIVTKLKIIAIIATLGMTQIIQGVSYTLCGGQGIYNLPKGFNILGQGYIGVIPISVILYAIIAAIVMFVLNQTYFGRYFYAVGGNSEASRLAGVDPMRIKFISYMISGLACGIAGIITMSRLNCAMPSTGLAMNMDVMTSVVLGGISAMVARNTVGKYSGVIGGSIIMAVISNGLVLMGAGEYIQLIIKGVILLLALSMDNFSIASIKNAFAKKHVPAE